MTEKGKPREDFKPSFDIDSILSIDADAHLEKLTTHTYRSVSHYPVELVHSALQRGASRISVRINRRQVEIRDNGSGIDGKQMALLKTVMETSSPEKKEQAIADLQNQEGIGLLSLFSPSPSVITITNITRTHHQHLEFKDHSLKEFTNPPPDNDASPIQTGTRLILVRKGNRADEEEEILREYCRGVKADLTLNGEPVGKKSIIRQVMVSLKLTHPESSLEGEVGIPRSGDVCQIWLLDQGIPVSRKIIAPWRGFLFDAALETGKELTGKLLDGILGDIARLYHHLIEQYPKLPPAYRHRIEELIFRHHRITLESTLVNRLAAFKVHDVTAPLTLGQLVNLSQRVTLYAIPLEEDVSRYNVSGKTVLRLNQQQIDHLVNHSSLDLQFLNPIPAPSLFSRCRYGFGEKWRRFPARLPLLRNRAISQSQLGREEQLFKSLLQENLKSRATETLDADAIESVDFVAGRGLFPWKLKKQKSGNGIPYFRLLLRREHPLVKKAVKSLSEDPENMKFLGWLFQ